MFPSPSAEPHASVESQAQEAVQVKRPTCLPLEREATTIAGWKAVTGKPSQASGTLPIGISRLSSIVCKHPHVQTREAGPLCIASRQSSLQQ
jgi:hypothetical protein